MVVLDGSPRRRIAAYAAAISGSVRGFFRGSSSRRLYSAALTHTNRSCGNCVAGAGAEAGALF
jgi:hypothetical protein